MPARQPRPTRSHDPEYLAELGGVLLAMTDPQRREFLAGLDRDNLEVAERALAARIAVSWRATPATMAHYLEPEFFELYDYWRLLGELFAGAFRGTDEPHQQWWVASQYGKAIEVGTPIPTPSGWRTMGDLAVEDEVIGGNGQPCRVSFVSEVRWGECWRLDFHDGGSLVADTDHQWKVWDFYAHDPVAWKERRAQTKGAWRVVTTADLIAAPPNRYRLPRQPALTLPDADLPLDPYVLGVWLGDGASRGAGLTCADDELLEHLAATGWPARRKPTPHDRWACTFSRGKKGRDADRFVTYLAALDLRGNKHVPEPYLWAGDKQRLSLLQGLMDTDGGVCRNQSGYTYCEFSSTNERLAAAVEHLARSLGIRAKTATGRATLYGKDCGPKWRVTFVTDLPVFRLSRKARLLYDIPGPRRGTGRVGIKRIERVPSVPCRCIQVDSPDGTYLAGRAMTVTHNTSLMANWGPVWALDMNPRLRLMYVSYDADKAVEEVGKARDIAERHYGHLRFRLRPDKRARGMWSTPQGGGLYAVGINGAIVGYPADGMLLDDLLKGWVEAHSPATRNRVWSIYRSQIRMRMQSETCPILCAGCLSADSRVPLVDGRWVPIVDVRPGDEVWAWGGAGLVSRKVLGQRKSGTSDTITVRTSRLSLTATGWHPFLVVSPDGHVRPEWAVEWRRADALQAGDLIVTMGEAATDGVAPVDGWERPDRMWLLGFLFGDGWVTSWARRNWYPQGNRYVHSRSWAVCVALGIDEALNERVAVAIEEAFGRRPRRNDGPRYWRLDCNDAGRTLGLLGLTPGRAADKRIPAWVFGLPTAAQRAFLQGLLDADGHQLATRFGQVLELGNPDLVEDARLLSMLCDVRVGTRRIRTRVAQPPNSPKPVVHTSAAALFTVDGRDVRGGSFITGDVPAGIRVERVRSITLAPTQDVYDLEVDGDESFVAEGFVVHNTRWHMDDVQARLLQLEEAEPAADHWKVTRLATVAEAPNPASSDPILRLPDPLGREVGQVLEPRRFSEREVATRFATLGSYLCTPAETPILMADWMTKPIAEVAPGDEIVGWVSEPGHKMRLLPSEVVGVTRLRGTVFDYTMESGRVIRATRDHRWFTRASRPYRPANVGTPLRFMCPIEEPEQNDERRLRLWNYLAGIVDGEGCIGKARVLNISQSLGRNEPVSRRILEVLDELEIPYHVAFRARVFSHWEDQVSIDITQTGSVYRKLLRLTDLAKRDQAISALYAGAGRTNRHKDRVVRIDRPVEEDVYALETVTGNYVAWGYASANSGSLEQQRPSPEEGGEIKRGWFRIAAQLPDHADDWLSSTDPKLKDKEAGDFVVVQVWARTGKDYWLVDQLRGQWSQAMTINAICLLSVRHPQVRRHVIENTGNGPEVMETLRTAMPDYVISEEMRSELGMTTEEAAAVESVRHRGLGGLIPNTPRGSKSVRMRAVSPLIEAGDVHLPDPTRVTWVAGLLDELAAFGSGSGHDDQCDALSQALSRLSHGTASVASPASAPLPTGGPSVRTGARFGVIPGARVR